MMQVVLAGIDLEHLESAVGAGLGQGDRPVSFGTNAWPDPEAFPANIPIYIYGVTRGTVESIPAATWTGTFVGYRRREHFADQQALDLTRPPSTIARRDPSLPDDEQEPEWPGYLMVTDLRRLEPFVSLRKFLVNERPFQGMVVRQPMLVEFAG